MKKLFVHQPLFRIFSPLFSGVIVYLLVLLINNNVGQLQEEFIAEDLYVFIGLSYLIQEAVRLLLWLLRRKKIAPNATFEILWQVLFSIVLCIVLVSLSMTYFFKYVAGYTINTEELLVFNGIFIVISMLYVLLFVSHQYLHKVNTAKLTHEELIRQNIEAEFKSFQQEVNPKLLFDSLETLLVLIDDNPEDAEAFIDELAVLYRYVLQMKDKQLVTVQQELTVARALIAMLNKLPLQGLTLQSKLEKDHFIVPGTLLKILETIARTSIVSQSKTTIHLTEEEEGIAISYATQDKIQDVIQLSKFQALLEVYKIYSETDWQMLHEKEQRLIRIPKLSVV